MPSASPCCFDDSGTGSLLVYKPSIVVYGAEGLHRYSTYIVQFSALDEITDNHAGNSPLVAPDGEGKAAVHETFLVRARVSILRRWSDWRVEPTEGDAMRTFAVALFRFGLYRSTQEVSTAFWLESNATWPYFYRTCQLYYFSP